MGDNVIVVNAKNIKLTGQKRQQKVYLRYSGYMGGQKQIPVNKMMESRPEEVVMHAVKGMLPKTRLGRRLLTNLRVYAGPEHPHQAQQPKSVDIS
jgi:large subunit ribosomal protein L13